VWVFAWVAVGCYLGLRKHNMVLRLLLPILVGGLAAGIMWVALSGSNFQQCFGF